MRFFKTPVGSFCIQAFFWISLVNAIVFVLGFFHAFTQLPPGWACPDASRNAKNDRDRCKPLPGWHFIDETDGTVIEIRNISTTNEKYQQDLDTAKHWGGLTTDQQDRILRLEATIYDFIPRPR